MAGFDGIEIALREAFMPWALGWKISVCATGTGSPDILVPRSIQQR